MPPVGIPERADAADAAGREWPAGPQGRGSDKAGHKRAGPGELVGLPGGHPARPGQDAGFPAKLAEGPYPRLPVAGEFRFAARSLPSRP
jgi:hypothetical protein